MQRTTITTLACYSTLWLMFLASINFAIVANAAAGSMPPKRLALVVGNASYVTAPLRNPINDAVAMEKALSDLGFHVTLVTNTDYDTLSSTVTEFYSSASKHDTTLFYYAGHAVQHNQQNYLLPIESGIHHEQDFRIKAYNINYLLGQVAQLENEINFVVLDACRINPFSTITPSDNTRQIGRRLARLSDGLAQMDAPPGTLIAFATEPGNTALDGTGLHGSYTKHLLKHIATPRLGVEAMFKRVRLGVIEETRRQQVPWEHSSLTEEFYFVSPDAIAKAKKDWLKVKDSESLEEINLFIETYPKSVYVELAQERLKQVKQKLGKQKKNRVYGSF